jgi:FAD/FMN-containing dehydrogenase
VDRAAALANPTAMSRRTSGRRPYPTSWSARSPSPRDRAAEALTRVAASELPSRIARSRRRPKTLADALIASASEETNQSYGLVELIHGRAHRLAGSWAAFGGRAGAANVTALAIWSDPADDEAEIAWARRFADRVSPLSLQGGGYLNTPELDQTAARAAAAYPAD